MTTAPMVEPILYRLGDLTVAVGLARSTIYKKMKAGQFPRPVRIFPGSHDVRWRAQDIRDWAAQLPTAVPLAKV